MSQLDRHLTTEQLSALLDDQFSLEEQADDYRGHLIACMECQHELAELRQTVTLLRALPQPALPRSFALPPGITQSITVGQQLAPNVHALRSANISRRNSVPAPYTVLRPASALAAVVGILFILSGFVTSMPHMATSSSTTASSANTSQPKASNGASSSASGLVLPTVASASERNNVTPTPHAVQSMQAPPAATQNEHDAGAAVQPAQPQVPATSAPPPSPASSFLDLNNTALRISLGILLFIAGTMGITLTRERRKRILHD